MQLHFQGGEDDHIWAYTDGKELAECLHQCEIKTTPYVELRFETEDCQLGTIVVMHPDMIDVDTEIVLEHIRARLKIFADILLNKVGLV